MGVHGSERSTKYLLVSDCQEGVPSQGGHQREEHRVVHRVQEEHNEGHIQ